MSLKPNGHLTQQPTPNLASNTGLGLKSQAIFEKDAYNSAALTTPVAIADGGTGGTDGSNLWQTGDIKATLRNTADAGWVLAFGQTVNATNSVYTTLYTYANTNGLIGAGKPFSGTQAAFVLPDLRSYVVAGIDTMGGAARGLIAALTGIGVTTGEATHTLTTGELASHSHSHTHGAHSHSHGHGITDPSHSHVMGINANAGAGSLVVAQWPGNLVNNPGNAGSESTSSNTTGISINADATAATPNADATTAGSGTAHNNVQPTFGVNLMIKL